MRKKIFSLIALLMLIASLSTLTFGGTMWDMIKKVETEGTTEFQLSNTGGKTSAEISSVLLTAITYANKSSLIVDNQMSMSIRVQQGKQYFTLKMPRKNMYVEVDAAIVKALSQYKDSPESIQLREAHAFVLKSLSYSEEYTSLVEGLKAGKGDCKVYTSLLARSLEYFGIEHRPVYTNLILNVQAHVHSLVKIDNEWFHVDATENDNLQETYRIYMTGSELAMKDRKLDTKIMGKLVPVLPKTIAKGRLLQYYSNVVHLRDKNITLLLGANGNIYYSNDNLRTVTYTGWAGKGLASLGTSVYTNISGKLHIIDVLTGKAVIVGTTSFNEFYNKDDLTVIGRSGKLERDVTLYSSYDGVTQLANKVRGK